MAKMGRPPKVIDYELVERLSQIQCTQDEIASILDVSVRTLQRDETFVIIYKKGMDSGRMSLRRYQWEAAKKGNTSMLIWLGKQYLGQSEHVVVDNKADAIKNVEDTIIKVREISKNVSG